MRSVGKSGEYSGVLMGNSSCHTTAHSKTQSNTQNPKPQHQYHHPSHISLLTLLNANLVDGTPPTPEKESSSLAEVCLLKGKVGLAGRTDNAL